MTEPTFPVPAIIALALAACGGGNERDTYEVDASDDSGGQFIARDPYPDEVQVDLPETAMTPVPAGDDNDKAD